MWARGFPNVKGLSSACQIDKLHCICFTMLFDVLFYLRFSGMWKTRSLSTKWAKHDMVVHMLRC